MPHTDRVIPVDDLFQEFNSIVFGFSSDLQSKITGFMSVSAVTSYELAIKDILIDFASSRHAEFGNFIRKHLSRINGNIQIQQIKDLIKSFDDNYSTKFENCLCDTESRLDVSQRYRMREDYKNLLTCRHKFVHGGHITLSFQECEASFNIGKNIINSLHTALTATK